METLILIASVLGSAIGGLRGTRIWYKHSQRLLTHETKPIGAFLGTATGGALMITLLGAGGF